MDLLVSNFYAGHDNKLKRALHINDRSLTEDEWQAVTDIHLAAGKVCMKLSANDLEFEDGVIIAPVGNYFPRGNHSVHVTVFTHETPNGIAWDAFNLNILDWQSCEEED